MLAIARITWKDILVIFRDRAALILMLGGPLLLTLGMGLVTGAFESDDASVFPTIPLLVVNRDEGPLGQELLEVFNGEELTDLIDARPVDDEAAARAQVQAGDVAALVVIPAGFSAAMVSDPAEPQPPAPIGLYVDPARTVSGGVVNSIVSEFIRQAQAGHAIAIVTRDQLAASGRVTPDQLSVLSQQPASTISGGPATLPQPIIVQIDTRRTETGPDFNPLAYFAPAMALLFLMYTVTIGARSFLAERQQKTLARMLVAPVSATQVLGGKVMGIFLSGAAQVSILVALSAILFNLSWGNPVGVALLILAAAAAATGWGLLVASLASTPAQIGTIGTTLMLSFGILGGSFVPLNEASPLLETLAKITPNAWALDGFSTLATGGSLADLALPLAALGIMAAVLFSIAALVFRRRQTTLTAA